LAVSVLSAALGLKVGAVQDEVDAIAAAMVAERIQQRMDGNFARADEIRAELEAMGWNVEDGGQGTRLHR
jgi:cysteinyl-tRNA synthetase